MGSRLKRIKQTQSQISWFIATSRGIRLKTAINIGVGLTIVFLDFAFIWTTKMIVDSATGQDTTPLITGFAILTSIAIANIALGFARRWIAALLGVKSQNMMQRRIFSRLMHSVWQGREKRHSGDVMNRLVSDANEITTTITDTFPSFMCTLVRIAIAFTYLHHFDSRLAYTIILASPLFLTLSKLYIKKMRALTLEIRATDSRIQSILQESIQHRMLIKTLEYTQATIDKLKTAQQSLQEQIRHRTIFSSTSAMILSTGFSAGYVITFIWGTYSLSRGTISYGTLLAFTALVGQIQGPIRDLTNYIPTLVSTLTAAARMQELEDTPIEDESNPIHLDKGYGIRLNDISYRYHDSERNILSHFSHDFPPGSTTAIIGETGAGKTTLIRLILALLRPTSGSIEFYNPTSRDTHPATPSMRCNLIYVPQGNTLLSGTIRDNLQLGNPQATPEEIRHALHTACADFINDLPQGLDTPCGEGGTGLSEGQAQRIAIARALLRQGNIMLLDEATSALDPATEQTVIRNIAQQTKTDGKTVLYITHRPAVLEYCEATVTLHKLKQT